MPKAKKEVRASVMLKSKYDKDLYDAITKTESRVQGLKTSSELVWELITDKYLPKRQNLRALCEEVYLPKEGQNLFDSLESIFIYLSQIAGTDKYIRSLNFILFFDSLIYVDYKFDCKIGDYVELCHYRDDIFKIVKKSEKYDLELERIKKMEKIFPKAFINFIINTFDETGKAPQTYKALSKLCKLIPYEDRNDTFQRSYLVDLIKRTL